MQKELDVKRQKKKEAQREYYQRNKDKISKYQLKYREDKKGQKPKVKASILKSDPEAIDRILTKVRSGVQKTLANPNDNTAYK